MTEPLHQKIKPRHLGRDAYLYVRQSSMRQVFENTESGLRQYQLRERALALGWRSEQIRVIDCDQGRSGASEAGRDGFQQLVADVSLGKAGIVMGLEVSRLARNNADWHRLLQLCAFTDSLILDQDGLYDPASFNDRLLLGLKGTMSEAELHVLRGRLQEGILSKARRGELKMPLPVGLVYDELDRVVLSPDGQVRAAIEWVFGAFTRLGSALAVVREARRDRLPMPHYSRTGPKSSRVIWGELSHSQVLRILNNPRYAGAFAYGRTRTRVSPDGAVRYHVAPREEWISLVRDAHPGYITWEEYERNGRALRANKRVSLEAHRAPAREGPALLQGLVICGRCGKRMSVRYHARRGRLLPEYGCRRDHIEEGGDRPCEVLPGAGIDRAISELLVELLDAEAVDLTVAVRREMECRLDEADRHRRQQIERCRYEADLAARRYHEVDPAKRYVAEVLEAEWNERLRQLDEAQAACEAARERDRAVIADEEIERLAGLPSQFRAIWTSATLGHQDRKRIVRLLIEDVTLLRADSIFVHVRLKGGLCQTLTLPLPLSLADARRTPERVITAIDTLLDDYPCYRVAEILNEQGLRSGTGQTFTQVRVERLCREHRIADRRQRLDRQGKLTALQLATRWQINPAKIRRCRELGLLTAHEVRRNQYVYDDPGPVLLDLIPGLQRNAHGLLTHTADEV